MNSKIDPGAEPAVVTGSREQLLYLLAEASEIEHTLMCSYLYAAFSLRRGEGEGLSTTEACAVDRWRKTIMNVAVEEMGHLLIVANLTVAVGGRPHFARPNFPVAPGYFPSGVVVRLTGFSRETLEHFIFLERPQGAPGDDNRTFNQKSYSRRQAVRGLMPSAQDYTTIGHLYEAIRVNLISLADHLGEGELFLGGARRQVGPDVVDFPGVTKIASLEAACTAIDLIIEQGEGSPGEQEESHYRSFLSIQNEFEELARGNPAFAPAWPVADNPALRLPPNLEDKVFVDHPEAAVLLDFTCSIYGLLLRLLVQSFGRAGEEAATQQKTLISAAIELMHTLAGASDQLARLPASLSTPGVNAGMSFTMLRGVEPLLDGRVEEQLVRERMRDLADAARTIPQLPSALSASLDQIAEAFFLQISS
ncbi:ferritin-like domain-containing protein [Muricoccus aerilatus]|uniref:ferritin-like domain-containing protein n=1 Tax=Muricoccus aerilatus TaxID=452982 RepID=UPI0005C1B2E3|nr:ferritin-like protein [Roseomonas aerilata]